MTWRTFLDDRVRLYQGSCTAALWDLDDDSVDAIVTDPPYGLEFMGETWDGDQAFCADLWREALRVLKPGGHCLAFGGTRTYHRLATALEDAGFEIRDMLAWVHGQGFPKSRDIAKDIDRRQDWRVLRELARTIRRARQALGLSQSAAARRCGLIGEGEELGGGGYMWFETGRIPTRQEWPRLKAGLRLADAFDAAFEAAERVVIGRHAEASATPGFGDLRFSFLSRDITAPATPAAIEWQGWGTALKPSLEPIAIARKPIVGTIAGNVLRHGTGALNIDACRIVGGERPLREVAPLRDEVAYDGRALAGRLDGSLQSSRAVGSTELGRWPANLAHDGSAEVVALFPQDAGAFAPVRGTEPSNKTAAIYNGGFSRDVPQPFHADKGSAARFFYTAKADGEERAGSAHPTVKPLDLMRWLVRLVTPPGGVVLDLFAGSGTTGEAAYLEGFRAILAELEPDHCEDIARRLELAVSGPMTRSTTIAKAVEVRRPHDWSGTLFEVREAAE